MTTAVAQDRFKDVMAGVGGPVTVVTAFDEGEPHGTTVTAFASLSLDPPMVTVALSENSSLLPRIIRSGRFGVNLLCASQEEPAARFARRDVDRFAGAHWYADNGLPRLAGCLGWVACDVAQAVRGGDHTLLLGAVTDAQQGTPEHPLIYVNRAFGMLLPGPGIMPAVTSRTVS
ncbi:MULTISPECIES: flavin reductase family protein [Streptomyces]|uniref:Putative oxidoreductase n=1 Tax=Streptomyces pyridomyceticus TaxID=68260 RepID=F6K7H2_9ACTN|nr:MULTISPECIES: flavin reductase family protein [Streptomyces]AEF33084.1 putative oxidoreductase [Streptomyces pyridomyceticus]